MNQHQASPPISRHPGLALCSLHFLIVWNLAVTQPLFDLLSRYAEFFVIRQSAPLDIILFVLLLFLGFPILLLLPVWGMNRIHKGISLSLLLCLLGACSAALAAQALQSVPQGPGSVIVAGASLIGLLTVVGYYRFPVIRTFFTMLSPSLVLVPVLFLFFSPISTLLFSQKSVAVAQVEIDNPPPIIMVVFDEFPLTSLLDENYQIDTVRYPNFAALAEQSTWFRNATTVSEETVVAVPSLLTGQYPDRFRMPRASDYPSNLFTLLGKTYTFEVNETRTQICPESLCGNGIVRQITLLGRMQSLLSDLSIVYLHLLTPHAWRIHLPSITHDWMNFTTVDKPMTEDTRNRTRLHQWLWKDIHLERPIERPQQFIQFIDSIRSTEQPTLFFLHVLLPHIPYRMLPSGKHYTVQSVLPRLDKGKRGDDTWEAIQNQQRFLLQAGFMDTLLGKLIRKLKTVGLYDSTLIVVTADHGVSFRPGDDRRRLTPTNAQDIMAIPLFIKAPFQKEGKASDQAVEIIDILPSIVDLLGIDPPEAMDGHSVFNPAFPDRTQKMIFGASFTEKEQVEIASETLRQGVRKTLKRQFEHFGSGHSRPNGLFTIGQYPDLIGKSVKTFVVEQDYHSAISIDQPERFAHVDPNATFIPAYITGQFYAGATEDMPVPTLVVAINGTIQAVTQPWVPLAKKDRRQWSALVPEEAFQQGQNDVEVFEIQQNGEEYLLLRSAGSIQELSGDTEVYQ